MAIPANSTILVTGSEGYIGRHLRRQLDFLGLDIRSPRVEERKSLTDFSARDPQYQEVRYVIHLADRRFCELNNENLDENIYQHRFFLEELSRLPNLKKVVFSSSCSVYGFSEDWVTEKSPLQPTSFYARSKLAVEEILGKYGYEHLILRFGTAYGLSPSMRDDLFVNMLVSAAREGKTLAVHELEAWRPYIHCEDFAQVLRKSLKAEWTGPLNVVTENYTKELLLQLPALKNSALKIVRSQQMETRNYRVRVHSHLIDNPRIMSEVLEEMIRYSHVGA